MTAANTFTLYGSEYPLDGQYAELMAQYLAPPSVSDKWTLIRDWADSRQVSADDMLCLLQAIDTGAANIMLGGQFKTSSDLDQIANKLGIDTTQKEPSKKVVAKVKDAFGRHWLNGSQIVEHTFLIDESGVYIWDDVSKTFTSCHSLSDRVLKRIRRLAEEEVSP